MNDKPVTVGDVLRAFDANELELPSANLLVLRKQLGQTQLQFAETMGVSLMTISRWERGEIAVPGPAQRLAQVLLALRPIVQLLHLP
jgi:DNA-binding transcriptional regulator YiaG